VKCVTSQQGTVHEKKGGKVGNNVGEKIADVTFSLTVENADDAYGRITIVDDEHPGLRFMRDPAIAGGGKHFILITASGSQIEVFFASSDGTFTCVSAGEAAEALG
jgi:hypothetical protein